MYKPLLKYCGCKSLDDLRLIAASRAALLGFVFVPGKRCVTSEQAAHWLKQIHPISQQVAGVFQNDSLSKIIQITNEVKLDIIQLHGEEDPAILKELKDKTKKQVFKAIPHQPGTTELMKKYASIADGFIIDTKSKESFGGTGKAFNWRIVPEYMEEAAKLGVPLWIAGGITPENIKELLPYQPFGLDISSGIEKEGVKNTLRINKLEREVDNYAANQTR